MGITEDIQLHLNIQLLKDFILNFWKQSDNKKKTHEKVILAVAILQNMYLKVNNSEAASAAVNKWS